MKKLYYVLISILVSFTLLGSCDKEMNVVPSTIQKIIRDSIVNEDCFDCRQLYQVDKYSYDGEIVFLFMYTSDGWDYFDYAVIYTCQGFSIGSCHFDDNHPINNPRNWGGCYEHFLGHSQYVQTIWKIQ